MNPAGRRTPKVRLPASFAHIRTMRSRLLPFLLPISFGLHAQQGPDLTALDAYIANAVQQFDQPGLAVGIVKDGQLVWSKGYGKLDLAKADPVTPNSVFYC